MKIFTLRLWAVLLLTMLLAGPAWAQPTWQWASQSSASPAGSVAFVVSTATDAAGSTVVMGGFTGSLVLGGTTLASAGALDLFVARLSPAGQWTQAVRAGGPGDDQPVAMTLDAAGTLTVAGSYGARNNGSSGYPITFGSLSLPAASQTALFVARLNLAGTWTQAFQLNNNNVVQPGALATDAAGNTVLVANSFGGAFTVGTTTVGNSLSGSGDMFVARLTPAGQWTQVVPAAGPNAASWPRPAGAAFDAAGNLVIAGMFDSTLNLTGLPPITSIGFYDVFVARLNPAGQWVQAVRAGSTADETVTCLALDGNGNAFVGGTFGSDPRTPAITFGNTTLITAGRQDVFVARLSAAGTWTQAVRAGGPNPDAVRGLTADAAGNALAAGYFGYEFGGTGGGTAAFGTTTFTSFGGGDMFLAKLSPTGSWGQALQLGGPLDDGITALAFGPSSEVTVAGFFTGTVGLGSTSLSTGSSQSAVFAARLSGFALATPAATPAEIFTLAPNPATAQVRLTWPEASAAPRPAQVLDGLGRPVRQQVLPARATSAAVDVQGLAPGLYLVRCGTATGRLVVE